MRISLAIGLVLIASALIGANIAMISGGEQTTGTQPASSGCSLPAALPCALGG